jgi:hypothetical protein
MNTVSGAALGLLVLSVGGFFPAVALARARMVVIPLVPLTGAVLSGLAVTAMTGIGGSIIEWFVILSVLAAAAVVLWWWRYPGARPWTSEAGRKPARGLCAAALGVGGIAGAFGLRGLKARTIGYDARTTWMVHPAWYLDGHATSVAALRNVALVFSHPPYPPLVGGAVAVSWLVSGLHTDRLGVVMMALLGTLAAIAAASALVEVARNLVRRTDESARRAVVLAVGVLAVGLLVLVAFGVSGVFMLDGYADALWSAAAVGAVAFGLVLPCETANTGAAVILATMAGTTKLEGSVTAAIIVGLIAARLLARELSSGRARAWLHAGVVAFGAWLVIGIWPLVIRLLSALPDRPVGGARRGDDFYRLHASTFALWSHLHIVAVAVAVAALGAFFLRSERRRAELGNDAWAWAALCAGILVVLFAYVVGPGSVEEWINTSISRIMTFAQLEAYWIMAIWAIIAVSEFLSPERLEISNLWGRRESNSRPRDYESPALTTELLPLA